MTGLRRLHKRRGTVVAAKIDLRTAPQQELDQFRMTFARRHVQRRGVRARGHVDVGAMGQHQLDDLGMTAKRRHMHRRDTALGAGADIGALGNQQPDDFDTARVRGDVERRRGIDGRAHVDRRSLLQEIDRKRHVAGRGGLVEHHVGGLDQAERRARAGRPRGRDAWRRRGLRGRHRQPAEHDDETEPARPVARRPMQRACRRFHGNLARPERGHRCPRPPIPPRFGFRIRRPPAGRA